MSHPMIGAYCVNQPMRRCPRNIGHCHTNTKFGFKNYQVEASMRFCRCVLSRETVRAWTDAAQAHEAIAGGRRQAAGTDQQQLRARRFGGWEEATQPASVAAGAAAPSKLGGGRCSGDGARGEGGRQRAVLPPPPPPLSPSRLWQLKCGPLRGGERLWYGGPPLPPPRLCWGPYRTRPPGRVTCPAGGPCNRPPWVGVGSGGRRGGSEAHTRVAGLVT